MKVTRAPHGFAITPPCSHLERRARQRVTDPWASSAARLWARLWDRSSGPVSDGVPELKIGLQTQLLLRLQRQLGLVRLKVAMHFPVERSSHGFLEEPAETAGGADTRQQQKDPLPYGLCGHAQAV